MDLSCSARARSSPCLHSQMAGYVERAADLSNTTPPVFLRFPTVLSGRCKENIEESWSCAEVRPLRRTASCRLDGGSPHQRDPHKGTLSCGLSSTTSSS